MRFARIAKVVKLSLSPMKSIWWDHSTPAQSNNGMSNAHRKTICKATEHRQLHCPRPTSSVCSVYQKPSERG